MTEFLSIVIIVFGVLQIILFFKVWGMTNNVSELRKMYDDRICIKKLKKTDIQYPFFLFCIFVYTVYIKIVDLSNTNIKRIYTIATIEKTA